MKRKSFALLASAVFSFAVVAAIGVSAAREGNLFQLSDAQSSGKSSGSYTITANDFSNGNGDIPDICGVSWHYNKATVSNGVVTIGGTFYTSSLSGSSKNEGRRGNGYTRMTFENLDVSHAVGLVYHLKNSENGISKGSNAVEADVDLTFGGTVDGADRRGIEFAQAEGTGQAFSFTSLTLYYDCAEVTPSVDITNTAVVLGVGNNEQLNTSSFDVFPGDTVSYSWESDDTSVATIVGNGNKATVTGVAAGTANVTVTMTVNGFDYEDSIEVTVNEIPADIVYMDVISKTSRVDGAGIFCIFDPSSASVTANQLDTFTSNVTLEFENETENAIKFYNLQDKSDASYTVYVSCDNAVGLNDKFTITAVFKDIANNINYTAVFHFDKGAIVPEIILTAESFSVNEGKNLEISAAKAYYIDGAPAFTFASLNTEVFTVASNGNIATVTGVKEGSAVLRVTMTINEKAYTFDKTIAVTKAGVQHLITWYTTGKDNQRNWWQGAGVWTWVNYDALGYDGFGAFSAKKDDITVSYESNPSTTIRVEVISDDIASLKVCRVYLVAGAAYNTGKLTMTIPDVNGITYTGTITFVDGEATAFNS